MMAGRKECCINVQGARPAASTRDCRPGLPIIAISGGASNSKLYLEIAAKIGSRHILEKPFGMAAMLAAITEVLGAAPKG